MIFHASIEADNPRKVATALAEILGGVATPFPPVGEGSWIAMSGDDKSAVEVYPQGTDITMADDLKPGSGKPEFYGTTVKRSTRGTASHLALGTELERDAIMALAKREGWPAQYYMRGAAQHSELFPNGAFGAIEVWIEGRTMIEVLTPSMQEQYTKFMNIRSWTGLLKHIGVMS
jgi:hypothetical protein